METIDGDYKDWCDEWEKWEEDERQNDNKIEESGNQTTQMETDEAKGRLPEEQIEMIFQNILNDMRQIQNISNVKVSGPEGLKNAPNGLFPKIEKHDYEHACNKKRAHNQRKG